MRSLALLAPLLFAACTQTVEDPAGLTADGYAALATGDLVGSSRAFERALGAIGDDRSHPSYYRAHLGAIQTLCASAPDQALRNFLELCEEAPSETTERDYARIAGALTDARHIDQASEVLVRGKARYSDSEELDRLGPKLVEFARAAGNDQVLGDLQSLGYVGDR